MRPLLAVVVSVVLCLPALAQPAPLDTKAIDRAVVSTMKAWQIPGLAIAVVKNDKVAYVQGYGVKDLTSNEPVTPDTLFQIGSASKAFTSTALSMLVDEGKLQWDDPVRQHLDYFRLTDMCADANVTIRDILSHRTGIATHDELWDGTPLSREEVVRAMTKLELARPFRGTYQYQNMMYIAAGEVVARAGGMPWDDFVRARIFKPLQMTSTVLTDEEWNAADHATGYRYDWKTNRIAPHRPMDTTTIGAGGAVKSSARDMANWLRFQLANGVIAGTQLVGAEALNETKTPHVPLRMENSTRDRHPESNVLSYALGWYVQDYRGELLVSHTGSLNGFRTNINLLPKRNSGFVVMANIGRGMALYALRNALGDLLTQKPARDWNAYYLMIDRKADEKAERDRLAHKATRKPNTTPSRAMADYAGTYISDSHGEAKISVVNNALVLQWQHITAPMEHFHYDVFTAASEYDDFEEDVAFGMSSDGEVKKLTIWGREFVRR